MENVQDQRLQSLIERIEKLEADKKDIATDIREIYAEARSAGYDTKIMREIIKLRKKSEAERQEEEYLIDTYSKALGL